MADLTTNYLGLTLKNPIIAGSSGLTSSVKEIKELEQNGVGGVVLKSLFEEQILLEADYQLKKAQDNDMIYSELSETLDYMDIHIKEKELNGYLEMIRELKDSVTIPIIASINCISSTEWTSFAKNIEDSGADAIELNIFVMPFSFDKSCNKNEQLYYDIVKKIKSVVKIPVSIKLSPYFSNLGKVILGLENAGADGIVMFNRFSSPDIDINSMKITVADKFSTPNEMFNPLRWVAITANRVKFDIAASTGIHDGEATIKQLLAGATAVQITSSIYKHGPHHIVNMLNFINEWMDKKGYNYIDQFRGKLSQATSENPDVFERIQFMKYFSEIK